MVNAYFIHKLTYLLCFKPQRGVLHINGMVETLSAPNVSNDLRSHFSSAQVWYVVRGCIKWRNDLNCDVNIKQLTNEQPTIKLFGA